MSGYEIFGIVMAVLFGAAIIYIGIKLQASEG